MGVLCQVTQWFPYANPIHVAVWGRNSPRGSYFVRVDCAKQTSCERAQSRAEISRHPTIICFSSCSCCLLWTKNATYRILEPDKLLDQSRFLGTCLSVPWVRFRVWFGAEWNGKIQPESRRGPKLPGCARHFMTMWILTVTLRSASQLFCTELQIKDILPSSFHTTNDRDLQLSRTSWHFWTSAGNFTRSIWQDAMTNILQTEKPKIHWTLDRSHRFSSTSWPVAIDLSLPN